MIKIVITKVAETPDRQNAIAAEVASADANTFTALFPISIALIRESCHF